MLTKFELKALGLTLQKDLSGLSLGLCEVRDGELWHEPVSFHPWKERNYSSQPTGIMVTPEQEEAMNRLAEELSRTAKEDAAAQEQHKKLNDALHKEMQGMSWTHLVQDPDGDFEIEVTVDGLGWTSGGCYGTFPREARTEAEARSLINSMAEGEMFHAMEE